MIVLCLTGLAILIWLLSLLSWMIQERAWPQSITRSLWLYIALTIAAFLGLAAFALFTHPPTGLSGLNPFSSEECENYSGSDYYACRLAIYTRQLAAFTALLFLATILVFIIGIYQAIQLRRHASHMESSVKTSREALVTTQRAFIFLADFDVEWARTTVIVKPQWANSGRSPPRDMIVKVDWRWVHFEAELAADFDYPYSRPAMKMLVGPETTEWSAPVEIPRNLANEAANGTRTIYIWGRVDYLDIFDAAKPHFTEWCYRIYIPTGAPQNWQFVAYGDRNKCD